MSSGTSNPPPGDKLNDRGRAVVGEELEVLGRVHARLERESQAPSEQIENLDAQLLELRDAIAEAKEEDVPSLIDQMHQVAALSRKRGQGRSIPIDPANPYFGHLRLREAKKRASRDVLIGKHTLLDDGDGVTIVDWRNAPVSRLYYRYDEGDEYEEEFDDRIIEGEVLLRRSIAVADAQLRRVTTPEETYAVGRDGQWQEAQGSARPTLQGGSGTALRAERGRLGVNDEDDTPRADKHLQEITALIDRAQFELITRPESGIVLIQGGAGSGKTTVALHRVAYLAFQDSERFRPERMIVVVFNDALVEYIRHVLPALGVEGVIVTTYRRWSRQIIRRLKLPVPAARLEETPDAVSRFKKHPVIIKMLEALQAEQLEEVGDQLARRLEGRPGAEEALRAWQSSPGLPPVVRAERAIEWVAKGRGRGLPGQTKAIVEGIFRSALEQFRDIIGDWMEINTSEERIREAIATHAADEFSDTEIGTIVRWCAKKSDIDTDDEVLRDGSGVGLDPEDDAILLRLLQMKRGGIFLGNKRHEYEHVVIDEAQDLCPIEVRVMLDMVSERRSVTIAGDRAQKMVFDNGFSDWPALLRDAGLPHVEIQPLKITYRSTRQVMEFSRHVLGPLFDPDDELIARDGAEVGYYGVGDVGEAVAFLGEALRGLVQREPSSSVALITRYPQQADVYYEALKVAEVPKLRRVRREDFKFTPGIDVTDIRQVKGLEFDYVVILDPTHQNYPEATQSRHLLHIAATRAAFQLWIVCAGQPSALVPPDLVATGGA